MVCVGALYTLLGVPSRGRHALAGRSVSAPGPIALSIVRARLARRFKSRRMCHQDGSSLRPLSISLCAHRLHGSAADEYKSGLCRSDAVGTQGERSGRGAPAAALHMRVSVFSTKTYERQFLDAANAVAGHSLGYLKSRLTLQTAIAAEGSKAIFVFVNDVLDRHVLQGPPRRSALRRFRCRAST